MGLFNTFFNRTKLNGRKPIEENHQKSLLKKELQDNIQKVRETFGNSPDIVIREIIIGSHRKINAAVIFASGLIDLQTINHSVMEFLMLDVRENDIEPTLLTNEFSMDILKNLFLPVGEVNEVENFETLLKGILSGDTAILLQGYSNGLLIGTKGGKDRGVQETSSQTVIRGPREGFSENIGTNIALVRRKIKDPNLWLESFEIGRVTRTDVSILYIRGIAMDSVIQEVRIRLKNIDIDGILESGYIEELIQDKTFTPFPTIFNTERPDVIAANLLEGRIAILIDGTPFVLVVPAIFTQFLQASDDYYQRADVATLLRLLRYFAFFIALLGPPLYIAITTFHHEMLPPQLLISLSAQREGIPFPAFVEALLMEMTFELLREAGIRLPKAVGQAISIVGALVIGQAAVQAGIVSAAMVIVVSITAISSFVIPAYNMGIPVRILRFGIMILAASFGLIGITLGAIAIIQHLCSLRSFGVSYLSPFAPALNEDKKDAILRVPWWAMLSRPRSISQANVVREGKPPTPKPKPTKE